MRFRSKLKLIGHFIVVILLVSQTTSCVDSKKSEGFKSNFSTTSREWIGSSYWANPLQDWKVENGELVCLVSKPNRNVHLLTHRVDSTTGNFSTKVKLQFLNFSVSENNENWVGFSLGSKGVFNDYRDNAVFGKGLNLGVSTNGNLFIKTLVDDKENLSVKPFLKSELLLEAQAKVYSEGLYTITLTLTDLEENKVISTLKEEGVKLNALVGDVVLVSNYIGAKNSKSTSVHFRDWELLGDKLESCETCSFGPILFSQYTLSKKVLKLTAQLAPVNLNDETVKLQINKNNNWVTIKESDIDKDARIATFKIPEWEVTKDIAYRIVYTLNGTNEENKTHYKEGIIRKEPINKEELVIAGFTGNDHEGFPNTDIVNQVKYHNPDVLFFSGDQIYEPTGGFGAQRFPLEKAKLDYLRKWYLFGWAFGDLLKDRPSVIIVDDHDVYHGNIWGAGGRPTPKELGQGAKAQDAGGYKMPVEFVNVVERTQTSHLPDAFDSTPIDQGIGVYYTDMAYGGISFAITEDRKFKSAPKGLLPEAKIKNGWALNKTFDIKDADLPEANLLGKRQLQFLESWVSDWSYQSEMKVLLSQTIFNNVATLPEEALTDAIVPKLRVLEKGDYPLNDIPVSDFDSNAWPQNKRNKALSILRKGFTFHMAGDQHLGSTIQYGIEQWNDAGFAFCVPSIINHWPRRWFPKDKGRSTHKGQPKYTGEFKDGFGNKMDVYAVSNPIFTEKKPSKVYDRAAGYGIVKLNKKNRSIKIECWPLGASPEKGATEMYNGWPITITQDQNYGRQATAHLPEVQIIGLDKPVIQIINELTGELEYSLRLNKPSYIPKVFSKNGSYKIRVGEPDKILWKEKTNVVVGSEDAIIFEFSK